MPHSQAKWVGTLPCEPDNRALQAEAIAEVRIGLYADGRYGVSTTIGARQDAIYARATERKLMRRIMPQVLEEFRDLVQSSSGSSVTE